MELTFNFFYIFFGVKEQRIGFPPAKVYGNTEQLPYIVQKKSKATNLGLKKKIRSFSCGKLCEKWHILESDHISWLSLSYIHCQYKKLCIRIYLL